VVDVECVGLPAVLAEREHQLRPQLLPQRVPGHLAGEFRQHLRGRVQGQPGIDPVLQRGHPQLRQPRRLRQSQRLGDVGQCRAAPQREGRIQLP